MSTDPSQAQGGQPSEEELRAAYEAEIKRLRVEQVVLENIVSLVNLGMRRTGLSPGTEDERDPAQVRLAIEAVRALTPLLDQIAPAQAKAIKDALSQLQLAFVRIGGQPPGPGQEAGAPGASEPAAPAGSGSPGGSGPGQPEPERPQSGEAGPAQRSGRLWVPGQ